MWGTKLVRALGRAFPSQLAVQTLWLVGLITLYRCFVVGGHFIYLSTGPLPKVQTNEF